MGVFDAGQRLLVLGAVLVFVAGAPASNAVAFPSETQTTQTQSSQAPAETVSSDTQVPSDAKGTPAPPSSAEAKRDKPAVVNPPTAEPSAPADQGTAGRGSSNVPAVPQPAGAAQPHVGTPPRSAALPTSAGASSAAPSYGAVESLGSTAEQKQPMNQVSTVEAAVPSPLVWWGMGLVLLSAVAGTVFLRIPGPDVTFDRHRGLPM
jgi:hypothetical protein